MFRDILFRKIIKMGSFPYYDDNLLNKLNECLKPHQLLAFQIFDGEEKEVDNYINSIKNIRKTDPYISKWYGDMEYDEIIDDYENSELKSKISEQLDYILIGLFRKKNCLFPLCRTIGNRVNFDYHYYHGWIVPSYNKNFNTNRIFRLFYQTYMWPNTFDSLKSDTIQLIAEKRFPERYEAFLEDFKKQHELFYKMCPNDIMNIIIEYIQPSKFCLESDMQLE